MANTSNLVNTSVVPEFSRLAPYYDDFDESKNYHRLTYRPGFAVQARELTQMQTLAQVQTERLGRHIFRNGSQVEGGFISYQNAKALNLASQFGNTDINVSNFIGKRIVRYDGLTNVRAIVLTAENAINSEPPTLMVKYLTSDEFVASDSIRVENETVYANVASANVSANGIISEVSDGIFFVKGFFVRTPRQVIILEKYKTTANAKIGFDIEESVVDSSDDTSLLDPAQGSSNFSAPGADRYKIDLIYSKRSYTSTDDESFIEVTRIEGGVQQKVLNIPYYSELEKTLARRTSDESGNYTVRPFKLNVEDDPDNSANLQVTVDSGKAYVYGYEFEPVVSTRLLVEKPRETANVTLYDISTAYGNYLLGKDLRGSFDFSTMPLLDIHCIPYEFVSTASQTSYDTTKIGTTRLRSVTHDSYGSVANAASYQSRIYIADSLFTSISANANSATAGTVVINYPRFSANSNAYQNATVRITTGTGAGYIGRANDWNGVTKTATVTPLFDTTPDTTSVISLEFGIKDAESFIRGGFGAITANLNISAESKSDGTANADVVMSESTYSSLLFPFPQDYVKANTGLNNYQYRKTFTNRTFTAGVGTITADAGEALIGTGALSDSVKVTNYTVIVTNNGGNTAWTNGAILPVATSLGRSITVAGSTATIDAATSNTFVGDVIASLEINSGTKTNPKSKTKIVSNTTHAVTVTANATILSGTTNTSIYLKDGQVRIINPNRIPARKDSLYISDVKKINAVYDLNGTAIVGGVALSGYTDVTSRYILDTGQKDTFYDHGALVLKSGVTAPKGPLLVCVDYYEHGSGTSDGSGFFSVDSYPEINTTDGYSDVPTYTDSKGEIYRLTDVIDFRPSRQNASNTTPSYTLNGVRIPTPNEEFTVNFEHYLPRRDIVIATKDRNFRYLKGVASSLPSPPNVPDDGMVIYRLFLNPYVINSKEDVIVNYVDNKRYTMRDIGAIDNRVKNLEYYNTLNALEKAAELLSIRDVNGLERTKYGIIADNFQNHSIGDVAHEDYRCSIDNVTNELRPFFYQGSFVMDYTASDSNIRKSGEVITLEFSEDEFITQNTASKAESVNYFLVAQFDGVLRLSPTSDQWVDTNQLPDVVVNDNGNADGWTSGTTTTTTTTTAATTNTQRTWGRNFGWWRFLLLGPIHFILPLPWRSRTTSSGAAAATTTTTTTTTIAPQQQTLGNRVTNVSIVPFIRPRDLYFASYSMRPLREVFHFFDGQSITNYVTRPNVLKLQSTSRFFDDIGINERVTIGTANSADILLSEFDTDGNTILHIANTRGTFVPGSTLTGALSGNTGIVLRYDHYSGNVVSGNTTHITFAVGASNVANYYSSNSLYMVDGTGEGQATTILSYNGSTRQAVVSPALSVSPSTNTRYSIGDHRVTVSGSTVGIFHIPSNDSLKFRTGARDFIITDSETNDNENYTTRAMAVYDTIGIEQDVQRTIQRPQPTVRRRVVDPLSQTFNVDPEFYPNGIFLSSVDIFFKSKDTSLPVWVEIRSTVNGFPSSTEILPYSVSTLFPDQVAISDNPSSGNNATKTNFPFVSPIYLEAGNEYALTVLSDSADYEVYIAEMGKRQLGTDRIISEQPYSGSLFKSQNGSVWTPFQFEDLMFVLNKCVFTTSPGQAFFENPIPVSNTAFDMIYLQKLDFKVGNTDITYAIKTTSNSTGSMGSFETIVAEEDFALSERKVVSVANARATLTTNDPDISPMLVSKSVNLITVANEINNLPLSNTIITFVDDGTGYSNASNIAVIFSGGGASVDANGYIGATDGSNLTSLIVDSGGSGYYRKANVTLSGGGGSSANLVVSSETDPSGGPALSRYITRKIVLNEGFNGGDLRLYLTAYKPVGTELYAYYKVKNEDDPDEFDAKEWLPLEQATPRNRVSTSDVDYREYEFRPSLTANSFSYFAHGTTFSSFNSLSIKVVFASETTLVVPKIRDFRAIALPAGD